ncbi:dTDP-4-dehydrorhamnose reductase [Aureimonas leprariae]|uniref:dTDP-4-dehydrorhamnose reductase n=1 Tax=Plantimonas leprariae TaxID=2615207 RepID=A0A7V7PN54_9HYPH|nr:dTDP-4-dehydrorhamnose reductase [Aureimonas leprariae]KAB0679044.1 dTDP-4-dehydrorhamnose reductase [Aureimonas leprariae]
MRRTVLVAGASGQVARSLAALDVPDLRFATLGRPDLDLSDPASIERAMDAHEPVAIVNAAAYTAVDRAETEPDAAFAINRDGASALAEAAARHGRPIVHISTDYVFDGTKPEPYVETDPTGPLGVYGRSKLEGEAAVAGANPAHVILRTAWVYSPYGANFLKTMLRLAGERDTVRVVADQRGTPTYAPDIAVGIAAVLRVALRQPGRTDWRGIVHMVAGGETTWAGFAEEILRGSAERAGPSARVEPVATPDHPTSAKRPANSRLATARFRRTFGHGLPEWQEGVRNCLDALRPVRATTASTNFGGAADDT